MKWAFTICHAEMKRNDVVTFAQWRQLYWYATKLQLGTRWCNFVQPTCMVGRQYHMRKKERNRIVSKNYSVRVMWISDDDLMWSPCTVTGNLSQELEKYLDQSSESSCHKTGHICSTYTFVEHRPVSGSDCYAVLIAMFYNYGTIYIVKFALAANLCHAFTLP